MMKNAFSAEIYRLARTWSTYGVAGSCVALGIFTALALRFLSEYIAGLPEEVLSPLFANGYYSLGFIKVKNLSDLQSISFETILIGAAASDVLPIMILAFSAYWVGGVAKSGLARSYIMDQHSRAQALVVQAGFVPLCAVIMSVAYFAALGAGSWIAWGGRVFADTDWVRIAALIVRHIFVMAAFSLVCAFICLCQKKSITAVITMLGLVLTIPLVLNIIRVLSGVDLFGLWILSVGQRWVSSQNPGLLSGFATIFFTLAVASAATGYFVLRQDIE
jgi:hypothetical protein